MKNNFNSVSNKTFLRKTVETKINKDIQKKDQERLTTIQYFEERDFIIKTLFTAMSQR